MKHASTLSLAFLMSAVAHAEEVAQQPSVAPFFQKHCSDCHDGASAEAGLDLRNLTNGKVDSPIVWEKVVRRLRSRQMPPVGSDRPQESEYRQVLESMEAELDRLAIQHPKPGRTESLRRLNRTEYRNSVRDLLAIEVDVDELLPADQSGHGFDNVTVADLSPSLLNRYVAAAEKAAAMAISRQTETIGGTIHRVPPDRTQERHIMGLPLGTRGGTVFQNHFPATGIYEFQVRLMRDRDENIEGLNAEHHIDLLVDRQPSHRFTVAPPKVRKGWKRDDTLVDAGLKKRIHVQAGPHEIAVTFPDNNESVSEIRRQPFQSAFNRHRHPRQRPAIYEVSVVGPFDAEPAGNTPSRKRVFQRQTSTPETLAEAVPIAEAIIKRLLRIAYRRPILQADLQTPMALFRQRFEADGFEPAMENAVAAILVSPHFLFRVEQDPIRSTHAQTYRVSDLELASRLSFFLWSSLPDDRLLTLAENGELNQADVLRRETKRMLKDARADSLVTNFAAQWLYLRNLKSFRPDMRLFPDFDDNLRDALRLETEYAFRHMLQKDESVLTLLNSSQTFLNERLAQHYEIPGVLGSHFRPVNVQEYGRGGLLRHGSILAVTSYATRTSPTLRGNWVLGNLLGTPPPPPPPNIPALAEKSSLATTTVRERLAQHRKNPACASCHDLIDPIGFALENFDAVGRQRIFDEELPIDSSGLMPDGTVIRNVEQLESALLKYPEVFVGTLAEKLLTFALGRGIEPSDGPYVRRIVKAAAEHDHRFSELITEIVLSEPFRMRERTAGRSDSE